MRLWGIPIKLHWTFGLLFVWLTFLGNRAGLDPDGLLRLYLFAGILFFCVVLHELGHSLAARYFQVQTKDIIISPIGGVARLINFPERPKHEFLIAVAGPLVNVIIALLLGLSLVIFTDQGISIIGNPDRIFNYPSNFLPALFFLNALLVVFNLVPAFPMDGGRVFRALMASRMGRKRATQWAAIVGQVLAVGLVAAGVYWTDLILGLIGAFVFFSAAQENRIVQAEILMRTTPVGQILRQRFTPVVHTTTMAGVFELMQQTDESDFVIVDSDGSVVGTLSEEHIEIAVDKNDLDVPVTTYMDDGYHQVSTDTSVRELLYLLQRNGSTIVPVWQAKFLAGVIDRKAVNQFINRHTSLRKRWWLP